MWDLEIDLLKEDGFTSDQIGNQIPKYKRSTVMGYEDRLSRNEFYQAGQSGIDLSKLFVIHPFEYSNEKIVEFEGQKYTIIRSYPRDSEELEIVCQIKLGEQNG
ncbi:phage head closure protein [Enterococcus gallinarum]|uniref:phage head closure protein n=1 Tax=Enterococcus TaxID=1350 RepID=UPI0035D7539F